MSEGSSRSSQEGLDGLHGDGRQQATLQRSQTASGVTECRPHPPVTRVCMSPHVQIGQPRLQLSIKPSVTPHLNTSTQGLHRASGNGPNPTTRPQGGANTGDGGPAMLNDCPPPYNAHHRLAVSQSSPQLAAAQRPPLQRGRLSAAQSNSASTTEAQMVPHSPEWQDWQRERWQIWQLLSSDNADTLPETLVWCVTVDLIMHDQPPPMTITPYPCLDVFFLPAFHPWRLSFPWTFCASPASKRRGVVVVYVRSCCLMQTFTSKSH